MIDEDSDNPVIMFDTRLSEYQGFFRGESFSREALQLSDSIGGMTKATYELLAAWRGASMASALPYLLVNGVVGFHEGYAKPSGKIDTREFEDAVLMLLSLRIPALVQNVEVTQKIKKELRNIATEVALTRERLFAPLDPEAIWESHLGKNQFKMGLSSLMKETLVSIFFAYEAFVICALKQKLHLKSIRTTDKSFEQKFAELFPGLLQSCWTSSAMKRWRDVRNSIAHADGLLLHDQLLAHGKLPVETAGGRLFVYPKHTRDMFSLLSKNVLKMLRSLAGRSSVRDHTDAGATSSNRNDLTQEAAEESILNDDQDQSH